MPSIKSTENLQTLIKVDKKLTNADTATLGKLQNIDNKLTKVDKGIRQVLLHILYEMHVFVVLIIRLHRFFIVKM